MEFVRILIGGTMVVLTVVLLAINLIPGHWQTICPCGCKIEYSTRVKCENREKVKCDVCDISLWDRVLLGVAKLDYSK